MSDLYNKGYEFLTWQSEVEVVFSLMSDKMLLEVHSGLEAIITERAYEEKEFPLSSGGLRFLQASIMFSFWIRKGKGIKIDEGKIVVCELKESPFWQRYQPPEISRDEQSGEYYVDNPDHERDQPQIEEERGEFI